MSKILKGSIVKSTKLDSAQRDLSLAKPVSVTEQVHSALSGAIISGKLKPGEVLVENDMQKWFGVSRTPIREAIRILEADGLVVVDAYKKKYVRRITKKYIRDLVQLASCMEGFAARLSIDHLTRDDISELEQINDKLNVAFDAKDYKKCTEQNFQFHRFIMLASDNALLRRVSKIATKPMEYIFITQIYFGQSDQIFKSINEHKSIIKAYYKGDADLVEKEIREHVLNTLKIFNKIATFDKKGDLIL